MKKSSGAMKQANPGRKDAPEQMTDLLPLSGVAKHTPYTPVRVNALSAAFTHGRKVEFMADMSGRE
jgi:hypothetical protein